MIKQLTPLTAIAMALLAAPAMAQTGHIGAAYSSNDDDDTEVSSYVVEGAAAFAFSDAFGAQIDGSIGQVEYEDEGDGYWDINAHLFYTMGALRVGGVFGSSEIDTGGIAPAATYWGVEGQYWFDRFVLSGSAIWGDGEGMISPDIEFNNYDINGDFYLTDNLVIGGTYGVGNIETPGGDSDTTSYGINGEWQLSSLPLSFQAGFQHWELDVIDYETDVLSVGLRWNWGGSVIERDRAGVRNTPTNLVSRYIGF